MPNSDKWIILGTAGHIDHGKTALIQALTGVDTDRLKEEKERGITIELGFAHLDLPNGRRLGIIDVPGHERFVRHMVAGVTSIDALLLIVAADEGIMPQTREHFDICRLLQIHQGVVVVTKTDLVESDWLDLVLEEIRDFVQGSFLENFPIFSVSSKTRAGIPALITGLQDLAAKVQPRSLSGVFRLPIDRVFTMKGFGTVITGTMLSGSLKKGMTIEIFPQGKKAKVRGIQVYNQLVEEAVAGQRTAINLQGVDRKDLDRGEVISVPSYLQPTYLLDARLHLLPSASHILKNRTRLRFHTGTSEVMARVILLDKKELEPGQDALVQFYLETPLALLAGDLFVVRSYSPVITIGGGKIIDNLPGRHRRFNSEVIQGLSILEKGEDWQAMEFLIHQSGRGGINGFQLETRLNRDRDQITSDLNLLQKRGKIVFIDNTEQWVIHQDFFQELLKRGIEILTDFHHRFPLKAGMSKEELKARLCLDLDPRLYNRILSALLEQKKIIIQEKNLRLFSHKIRLTPEEEKQKSKILSIYNRAGCQPPNLDDVLQSCQGTKVDVLRIVNFLVDEGMLVKLKEGLLFHQEILSEIRQKLETYFLKNADITVPVFKDLFGFSRKYAISLFEYFDSTNFTMRLGDKRILKKKRGTS